MYDMLVVNTMVLEKIENVRESLSFAAQDDTIPSDLYMQLLSCVNVWKLESRKLCIDMYGMAINKTMFVVIILAIFISGGLSIFNFASG